MKIEFKFKNGQKVREIITDFEGIIDMQCVKSTGNIQYSIQPKSEEGKNNRPEGWFIDEEGLEFLEEAIPNRGRFTVDFKYDNGICVKDKISGFEGIITRTTLHLNGCINYLVTGKYSEKLGKPAVLWVDESEIEVVSEGVKKDLEPKRTGGPVSSSNSARL